MVGILILVVVFVVIAIVVKWFVDYMELDPPLRKIILLITGLVFLIALLSQVGVFGAGPVLIVR